MERSKDLPMTLTELQFELLNQLYFTNSFDMLINHLSITEQVLEQELKLLLGAGLIQQLYYDMQSNDYVIYDRPDMNLFKNSAFVISKKGLLTHNSR
jgi:hypothetical protein